jgi:hypothetical protein
MINSFVYRQFISSEPGWIVAVLCGMTRSLFGVLTILVILLFRPADAGATATFLGSGSGLSAKAEFTISGTTLTILLTNTDAATGGGAPDATNEVLTGVYFNLGSGAFVPVSAMIVTGEVVQETQCSENCAGATNVGGEWGYDFGTAGFAPGANQGLASAGYLNTGLSNNLGNFPSSGGTNLDDPDSLNGANFGIVPLGFVEYSGNGGMDNDPLISGTVQFVLTIPAGLTESDIKNVTFTYGTNPDKTIPSSTTTTTTTTGTSIPEPAALALFGLGLTVAAVRLRRRRRSA